MTDRADSFSCFVQFVRLFLHCSWNKHQPWFNYDGARRLRSFGCQLCMHRTYSRDFERWRRGG